MTVPTKAVAQLDAEIVAQSCMACQANDILYQLMLYTDVH